MEREAVVGNKEQQITEYSEPLFSKKRGKLIYASFFRYLFYTISILSGVAAATFWGMYQLCLWIGYYGDAQYISYITALSCFAVFALFAALSILVTGRRRTDRDIHFTGLDRIPGEISFFVSFILTCFMMNRMENVDFMLDGLRETAMAIMPIKAVVATVATPIAFVFALSAIRLIKGRSTNWLCYRFSEQIRQFAVKFWKKCKLLWKELTDVTRFEKYSFQKQMFLRQSIFVGSIFALLLLNLILGLAGAYYSGAGILFLMITILLVILLSIWYVRGYNQVNNNIGQIIDQISEIHKGNLAYRSRIVPTEPLYSASQALSSISAGFQKSVEERIKSERMKVELVTNVSHDLKTPLTSIISYIDLLSKDDTLSSEAKDYVLILGKKADRLKNIVADLFDLAKVTSGNTEVFKEELDMSKLVVQTLADMSDKIEESGQIVKTHLVEPPIPIYADGKKMYRVLQNIFDNALKYSMKGTRIFIDLDRDQWNARLIVKNTAAYEMDFTEDEILERFTRGDKSRTTEGNGLGLSIAKSFTLASGGMFELAIDGDQFKVTVTFPIYHENEAASAQEVRSSSPKETASVPVAMPSVDELAFREQNQQINPLGDLTGNQQSTAPMWHYPLPESDSKSGFFRRKKRQ